jgi:hypothetical protein
MMHPFGPRSFIGLIAKRASPRARGSPPRRDECRAGASQPNETPDGGGAHVLFKPPACRGAPADGGGMRVLALAGHDPGGGVTDFRYETVASVSGGVVKSLRACRQS